MAKPKSQTVPRTPDPRIEIDEGCCQRFPITAVAGLLRHVELDLAPPRMSPTDMKRWYGRYHNPAVSFAYVWASAQLDQLHQEAIARQICRDPEEPPQFPDFDPIEAAAKFGNFENYVRSLAERLPDNHPFAQDCRDLLRPLRIASHWPDMMARRSQHGRAERVRRKLTRAILDKRPRDEISAASQELDAAAGRGASAALKRFLKEADDPPLISDIRVRSILRGSRLSRSGKHNSDLAQFVRGDMADTFEFLFDRPAGGSSQRDKDSNAPNSKPYGHFVRFASWFLARIGASRNSKIISAETITTYVNDRGR